MTTPQLTRADITGIWAGLRPLLAPEQKGSTSSERTADLSRRHTVRTSARGVVTVTGGKLTTYRKMAEDTVDAVVTGSRASTAAPALRHEGTSGSTAPHRPSTREPTVGAGPAHPGHASTWPVASAPRHLRVLAMAEGRPELLEPAGRGLPYLAVEALWAVRGRWPARLTTCCRGAPARTDSSDGHAGIDAAAAVGCAHRSRHRLGRRQRRGGRLGRAAIDVESGRDRRARDGRALGDAGRRRPPLRPTPIDAARRPGGDGPPRARRVRRRPAAVLDRVASSGALSSPTTTGPRPARDWWPLAIGWAAPGAVPAAARRGGPAQPTPRRCRPSSPCATTPGCPVTPAGGRSGVCGGSIPAVRGRGPRPVRPGRHRRRRRRRRWWRTCRAGTFGPDVEAALRRRSRAHPRPLAPVDGPLHGGRVAGLPGGGPVLEPVREDRGHGPRPRGRAGRRAHRAHRGPRPPRGHRARPHPALRGQRGHPRRDHRGPVPGPPGADGRGASGLRLHAPSPTGSRPAAGSSAGAPRPAVLRLYDATESGRNFDQPDTNVLIVLDEADPALVDATLAVVDEECAGADALTLDPGLVDRWLGHRNDVSALAPLWRGGVVVDTVEVSGPVGGAARPLRGRARPPWTSVEGTLVASSHQSHAYTDGACLYFTFAGRPPEDDAGPAEAGRWIGDYYRQAWDEVTGATLAPVGRSATTTASGSTGAGSSPTRLGPGFDGAAPVKSALDPPASSTRASSACPPRSARCPGRPSGAASSSSTSAPRACGRRWCGPTPPSSTTTTSRSCPTPRSPGLVEFDAARPWPPPSSTVAARSLADGGPVAAVGIANQRASTLVWDRASGRPVAPGIGWQDLRTVGTCLELQGQGIRLAPNASATKVMAILDEADPDRSRAEQGELCFGTVDSWVAWTLSGGRRERCAPRDRCVQRRRDRARRRRRRSAGTTPLLETLRIPDGGAADDRRLLRDDRRRHGPRRCTAHRRHGRGPAGVPRSARAAPFPDWPRQPSAPAACSTSAPGADRPAHGRRGAAGTFPIIALRVGGRATWGIEAIMLSAGTCVEWLRDDLGIIDRRPVSRRRWPLQCATPATSGSCRRFWAWARRSGTSGRGAPSSG